MWGAGFEPPRIPAVFHCVLVSELRAGKWGASVILAASATVVRGPKTQCTVEVYPAADSVTKFRFGLLDLLDPFACPTWGTWCA